MTKITCCLALLMGLRSHKTCNQENKYMVMFRTTLCINIMQFIPWRSKRVGSYLDLTIKFHDYSSFLQLLTTNMVIMYGFVAIVTQLWHLNLIVINCAFSFETSWCGSVVNESCFFFYCPGKRWKGFSKL